MIGSAPVPVGAARRFYEHFGIRLIQGYGTTEVSLRVTGVPTDLSDAEYREVLEANAAGVELANCNVRIDGDLAEGELGEILVRGPVVSAGYLNEPDATAEVFRDGWFRTGDIGYHRAIAGGRYFFVHGRVKEIIIKGGVNISPIAVENALVEALEDVVAAYVVGIDHPRWGEAICAAVVIENGLSPEAARARAAWIVETGQAGGIPGLSAYEAPSRVIPVQPESLPMTSTGKVQRSALREVVRRMICSDTA